jgi:hypothetical protein
VTEGRKVYTFDFTVRVLEIGPRVGTVLREEKPTANEILALPKNPHVSTDFKSPMDEPNVPSELEIGLSSKDVQSIVEDANKGQLVLPAFQRDFMWPTSQVGKLLESLLNGYYINTLLTLPVTRGSNDKVPFPTKKVEGVSGEPDGSAQIDMILDGQQRVTSIYYALTAPRDLPLDNTKYPQLYCLRFAKAIKGQFDDDAVLWRRRDWSTSQRLVDNDFEMQVDKGLIPFTAFKSKQSFREWRREISQFVKENEVELGQLEAGRPLARKDIDRVEDTTEVFRNYDVPIIQMTGGTEASKVVQTFERINTQGLELGIFDILTARLWPDGIRLRNLWDEAVAEHDQLKKYKDKVGVTTARERTLRTLALHRGQECSERSLGELGAFEFENDWRAATEILSRTLAKAQTAGPGGLGVSDRFGFPYGTILPPLANLIHIAETEGAYPDEKALRKVRRWYWASIFSQRYSGSSDTASFKDCNTVGEWLTNSGVEEPVSIREARQLIPIEIDLMSLTQGGAYRGTMSMITRNNARDFGSLESVSVHEVDDHHIFPKSGLKDGEFGGQYDQPERDRILNRTIIQSRTNRFRYSNRRPSDYVSEMLQQCGGSKDRLQEEVLSDHFINDEALSAMLQDDYERFCEARREELQSAIERRTGLDLDWTLNEAEVG